MIHLKTERLGKQYRKDDNASGISLPKGMRLPNLGDDPDKAKYNVFVILTVSLQPNDFFHRRRQLLFNFLGIRIAHRVAA